MMLISSQTTIISLHDDCGGDWAWQVSLPHGGWGPGPLETGGIRISSTLVAIELREVSHGVVENIEVETKEDEDVPQKVIPPPQIEGISEAKLLVKCFHSVVDYLIEED